MGPDGLDKISTLLYAGLYDVRTGNVASARAKVDEMKALAVTAGEKEKEKAFSDMGLSQLEYEVLFAEGKYDEALAVYAKRPLVKIDLSSAATVLARNVPFLDDFAARVYQKKGAPDKALAEYERLVVPEAKGREGVLVHPFSRLRLAALYEAKGDLDRARGQYKILWTIWRQGDPSLSEVATVRKKIARIKGGAAGAAGPSVESFFSVPFVGGGEI